MQDQFAQRPEDEEGEESADGVGDDQGRAGGVEPAAGAEEQAGTDRAADGDHLDLPRLEVLVIALVLRVEGRFGGVRVAAVDDVVRCNILVLYNLVIGVDGHG